MSTQELHDVPEKERVKVVKINKARVNYFFTDANRYDLSNFFNTCEIEFRITFGNNWNNYLAVSKGPFLNYFSNVDFKRGSE